MWNHSDLSDDEVRALIKSGAITFGGNRDALIYGTLSCWQGKRLTRKQRVFFAGEAEAQAQGYRPCYSCMRRAYNSWSAARQITGTDGDGLRE